MEVEIHMKIPEPILRRVAGIYLCTSFLAVVGIVAGFMMLDAKLFLLTLAVVVLGVLSAVELYYAAADGRYEIIEGTVLSARVIRMRNRQVVRIKGSDGCERILHVTGRSLLRPGRSYRLYVQRQDPIFNDEGLLCLLQPAQTIMGVEYLQLEV